MPACTLTWSREKPRTLPQHGTEADPHACVFVTAGPHSRHECRCGLTAYEEVPALGGSGSSQAMPDASTVRG